MWRMDSMADTYVEECATAEQAAVLADWQTTVSETWASIMQRCDHASDTLGRALC